jgi:hypothetical protein
MPVFCKYNKVVIVFSVIALMILPGSIIWAQKSVKNKTVVVVGSAPVFSGNVQSAREKAIRDGLVMAVARMTEEILQVEALVDNFPRVNELVYEQTDKYVQDYKVLTETTSDSGKFYRVVVQATVAGRKMAKLLSDQGILQVRTALPSVVFLIAEQNVKEILPRYWWGAGMGNFQSVSERAVAEVLKTKGYKVVGHKNVRLHNMVDWVADAQPNLSDERAVEIGTNMNADIVVVGSASASESTNTMGLEMKSFNGLFNARVLRTETGEEMFAVSRDSVATNVNEHEGGIEALLGAGNVAGEMLAVQLASAWRKVLEKPSQVEIVVGGTNQLANFVKFRKALSNTSGVEGIQVKEIKPNQTTLLVYFHGKAEELASALMLKTFEKFGIDIYEIAEDSLKIALIAG